MKTHMVKSVMATILLVAASNALANEVIEAWGYGTTAFAARNDARTLGRQACFDQGYSFASFELVDVYPSGGNYAAYGLAYCWN